MLQSYAWLTSADGAAGLQLRLLGSARDLDGGELPELYGYPTDHDGVWVRANFIASLDGGATAAANPAQLGGPGDRVDVQRAARTRRRHRGRRGHRAGRGLLRRTPNRRPAPAPAGPRAKRSPAVGDRHQIRAPGPGYAGVHPHRGAAAGAAPARRPPTRPGARWPAWPRWSTVRSTTRPRSTRPPCWRCWPNAACRRVLTEGGPMLLGSFVERGLLDELCLTIAPTLVGGQAGRIATGPEPGADRDALGPRPDRRRRLPVHALRARRLIDQPMATVVGMSRHAAFTSSLIVVTACAGRLRAWTWPPTRASPPTPAPGRRARQRRQRRPMVRRRSPSRRTTCRGTTAHRGFSATPRSPRRPASSWIAQTTTPTSTRSTAAAGTLSIGVVRARSAQTPDDAGPLVFTTGSDLPSSTATAGVAVARRRRRAANTPHRRRRPPRHGHIEPDRLPRPVRPPGDARPGAVPGRQRSRSQSRRHRAKRHHQLHRHHRARRLRLRQHPRRLRYRATAQHLGRTRAGADRHRQRRPGGAVLRQRAPGQGRQA